MTTARSIVCDSCGSDVPTGRLSCPACGDLLASVAGGSRRAAVLHAIPPTDGDGATDSGRTVGPLTGARTTPPLAGARMAPAILRDLDTAASDGAPADVTSRTGDEDGLSALTAEPAAGWDAATTWDEDAVDPAPGAWVPPRAPVAEVHLPSGIAAPARAWAGHGRGIDAADAGPGYPATPRFDAAASAGHVAPSAAALVAGAVVAGAADDAHPVNAEGVDGARLAEFVGWLAIAGGALSAVGFLLPWGSSMIGATGTDYVSRWGIAGPFHIMVALMVVALVVLAVVPNPIPAWIRIGIAGTMLSAFLLGLAWPYVFGLSSAGPGALAVAIGAVVLLAAGIICLGTERHRAAGPAV